MIITNNESCVSAYELKTQQHITAVWLFQDEPNSTKLVKAGNTSKETSSFLIKIDHVSTVSLEIRRGVNYQYTASFVCWTSSVKYEKLNNVDCYTFRLTIDYQTIDLMGLTRYNPDLSPNDYFLFPNFKMKSYGRITF